MAAGVLSSSSPVKERARILCFLSGSSGADPCCPHQGPLHLSAHPLTPVSQGYIPKDLPVLGSAFGET